MNFDQLLKYFLFSLGFFGTLQRCSGNTFLARLQRSILGSWCSHVTSYAMKLQKSCSTWPMNSLQCPFIQCCLGNNTQQVFFPAEFLKIEISWESRRSWPKRLFHGNANELHTTLLQLKNPQRATYNKNKKKRNTSVASWHVTHYKLEKTYRYL